MDKATPTPSPAEKIWTCKIGGNADTPTPRWSDGPMRQAVEAAFEKVTGKAPAFLFSGWGSSLTEPERAVVENRLPNRAEVERLAAQTAPTDNSNCETRLWLWKNFVDGRPEYWAFDNPYPINLDNGDPQTLGEPCGYAIFKPSRGGRPDFSEDEVLLRIAQAESKVSYNLGPNKADADAFDFLRFAKKNLDMHAARVPFAYNGLVTAAVAWIQSAEKILAAQSPAQAPVQPQAVVPAPGGDRWHDAALPPEIEQRLGPWLTNGAALHPATVNLVVRFARALSKKLAAAETKYGYSDGWLSPDWMDECRAKLMDHIVKGDPRDVAAYCAFLWHHGASTVADQPSQAPVVQAVQATGYPPLPEPKVARVRCEDCEGSGALRVSPDPERADEVCSVCRGRGWSSETLVHVEDDIRAFADATCAMRASHGATPAAALTEPEIKALTAMVWGAPCSGRDLAIVTSTVRAMEELGPGERPIDPAKGGRLLDVDACIVEPAAALAAEGQTP